MWHDLYPREWWCGPEWWVAGLGAQTFALQMSTLVFSVGCVSPVRITCLLVQPQSGIRCLWDACALLWWSDWQFVQLNVMSLPGLATSVSYMDLNCYSVDGNSASVLCFCYKLLSKGLLTNRYSNNLQLLEVIKAVGEYSSDVKPFFFWVRHSLFIVSK